jgi:hypothetical protein
MIVTKLTQKIESWASDAGLFYRLVEKYYKNMVQNETALAGIGAKDKILCIGGGCCPFSAILFHRLTGAKVTVVERCEHCIKGAQKVVNRLGLGDYITVIHHDGCPENIKEFSVVHLALQVNPIQQVFADVESRMKPGAKLLIRQPKKGLCCLYSKFSKASLAGCDYVTHKSRGVGRTLLYRQV